MVRKIGRASKYLIKNGHVATFAGFEKPHHDVVANGPVRLPLLDDRSNQVEILSEPAPGEEVHELGQEDARRRADHEREQPEEEDVDHPGHEKALGAPVGTPRCE